MELTPALSKFLHSPSSLPLPETPMLGSDWDMVTIAVYVSYYCQSDYNDPVLVGTK